MKNHGIRYRNNISRLHKLGCLKAFLINTSLAGYCADTILSEEFGEMLIGGAFCWADTKEGHQFWESKASAMEYLHAESKKK